MLGHPNNIQEFNLILPESNFQCLPIALSCSQCNHEKEPMYCSIDCQSSAQACMYPTLHNLCQCSGSTIFDEETKSTLEILIQKILPPFINSWDDQETLERSSIIMTALVYFSILLHSSKSPFYDLVIDTIYNQDLKYCSTFVDSQQVVEWSYECWSAFYGVIRTDDSLLSHDTRLYAIFKDSMNFLRIRRYIYSKCLVPISWPHPVTRYIQTKLLSLKDNELNIVLMNLQELVNIVRNYNFNGIDDATSLTLTDWRKAVRLIQYVDEELFDRAVDDDKGASARSKLFKQKQNFYHMLQRRCVILDTHHSKISHSCVPNSILEASTIDRSNDGLGRLKYQLSALHPISVGEPFTISKIHDLTEDFDQRQLALRVIFGKNFICDCFRCIFERNWHRRYDHSVLSSSSLADHDIATRSYQRDLKRLGDLAMQQGRFQEAEDIYSTLLKYEPKNGDVLHARCASHLARGNYLRANTMWKEASKLSPNHEGIELHLRKFSTYYQGIQHWDYPSASSIKYQTVIARKCFITDDDTPLLHREECTNIVQIAETEALQRATGWTTSRHYAVPTTDLPIHEIPSLVLIFNKLMNRVQPLLQRQFGDSLGAVYVHDAFIVKYDAAKQRHLPFHRDESTHSFIIALNDTCDYDGGGTFIAAFNNVLRPKLGGMVSFRGDELLHAGDPVVRGVRYIIAAFCYAASIEDDIEGIPLTKKRKGDDNVVDASSLGSTFTFNFQV